MMRLLSAPTLPGIADLTPTQQIQVITIPAYTTFSGLGTGTCYMSVELRANTCNEAVFAVNDSTAWVQVSEIKFTGLSTTSWTTYTWSFSIPTNGTMNFHIGYIPSNSSLTQAPGIIHMKNLRLYKTGASATISSQLNCSEHVDVAALLPPQDSPPRVTGQSTTTFRMRRLMIARRSWRMSTSRHM